MLEIVSGILGILGFLISVVNLYFFFLTRKKKLSICIKQFRVNTDYADMLTVYIRFDNLSEMPISITQIRLIVDGKYYDVFPCPMIAVEWKSSNNGKILHDYAIATHTDTINLNPLESAYKYLAFQIPRGSVSVDEKSLTFEICTNRGKKVQKSFALCADTLCR